MEETQPIEPTPSPNPLVFPLAFSQCPVCGSTERVANIIGEAEKAKGKIRKSAVCVALLNQLVISDPGITVLSAPALTTGYDICAKCGTVYCVFAECNTAAATAQVVPKGGNHHGRN